MRLLLHIIFLVLLGSQLSLAQKAPYVIDTVEVNSSKILIYSNRTWSYMTSANFDSTSLLTIDTTNLFTSHWTNDQIFAYLGDKDLGGVNRFEIELLDSNKIFTLPIFGKMYRGFGRGHDGLDIGLKKGDTIKAAFDGKVRYSKYNKGGYGNLVIIRHFNGLETYYAHLSKLLIDINQDVKAGDIIGLGGSTGRSVSPHLHFEIRYRDKPMDPLKFINFEEKQLVAGYKLIIDKNKPLDEERKTLVDNSKGGKFHSVRKGDTLNKIARKYRTSVKAICKLNGFSEKTMLRLGSRIKVS